MRLICDKCDKEIEDFMVVIQPQYHEICVECHGQEASHRIETNFTAFETASHGDIHFFEEEDKEDPWAMPSRGKDAPVWGQSVVEKLMELKNKYHDETKTLRIELETARIAANAWEDAYHREVEKGKSKGCEDCELLKEKDETEIEIRTDIAALQLKERMLCDELLVGKPLIWSKEKPTEPGQWWFYRQKEWAGEPYYKILETYYYQKVAHIKLYARDYKIDQSSGEWVESCLGEWAGPIPEPEEEEVNDLTWG